MLSKNRPKLLSRCDPVLFPETLSAQFHSDSFKDTRLRLSVPRKRDYKIVYRIILGDFNSKVGERQAGEDCVGNHGFGIRNATGQQPVDFCGDRCLRVSNTFFRKRQSRKHTWVGPNRSVRNMIDYIPTPKGLIVTDVDVVNRFDFTTDHRLVRAVVKVTTNPSRTFSARPCFRINRPLYSYALEREMEALPPDPSYRAVLRAI